ncbi:MAG: hypothetical protein NC181_02060 [Clostridium sp.]|nr:hypothetical protein [Clostridium sp.]MCM1444091.1 hypothetical protein [Candidatus Amulumruptor caecigallinarius]
MSKGKIGMRIGESVFVIGYLLFDLIAGIIFLKNSSRELFLLYGIMTLILGFGDSFHLIPRVIKNIKGESKKVKWWMNLGLVVTSISMTIFYILLFYIWKMNYDKTVHSIIPILIWSTALMRIIICLLPQNNWFKNGNKKLSLCRNVLFAITGGIEVILFLISGGTFGITMAICIILSFVFYIPVTLFAKENPKIGMLMIPKTIMYIIMISLGLTML